VLDHSKTAAERPPFLLPRRRSPHGLRTGSFLLPFRDTIALTAGVIALTEALQTEHAPRRSSMGPQDVMEQPHEQAENTHQS